MSDQRKEKACKYCGEAILETAKKCKHCGEFLDGTKPPKSSKEEEDGCAWILIIAAGIVLGFLAIAFA